MKKYWYISAFAFIIFCSFTMQDFLTTMTKVEYDLGARTVKLATKIDVEQIEGTLGKKINAGDFEQNLKGYLQRNIDVYINDQNVKYNYVGKQESGGIIWVYYEVGNVGDVSTLTIRNSMFFEKSPNQQNFVSLNINGKKGSFVCTKAKDSGKQQF